MLKMSHAKNVLSFLCSLPEKSFVKYVICIEIKIKQNGSETFSVANNSNFETLKGI